MTDGAAFDLSGDWTGLFNYPVLLPTTNFTASLRDASGQITGLTAESGDSLGLAGTVQAVIEGHHVGGILRFTKVYDSLVHACHPIFYEGVIVEGGDEISGEWRIPGHWSGTFLMIRNPGVGATARRTARATV